MTRWPAWYVTKFKFLLFGLLIVIGSTFWMNNQQPAEPSEKEIVRAIRLLTHPMMYSIEEQASLFLSHPSKRYEHVDTWLKLMDEVQFQIVMQDGLVIYNSHELEGGIAEQDTFVRIQPRFELDYGLRVRKDIPISYHLALPLFDHDSQKWLGYVQFHVPANALRPFLPTSGQWPHILSVAMLVAGCVLIVYIAVVVGHRLHRHYLKPIRALKLRAEAILQGNYEQRAEWERNDEVGELYAVFDQMRAEIHDLNVKQMVQSQAHKELISNLSHDLKTPLATVKAYMEAMLGGLATDEASREQYIQIALVHLNKMTVQIDDLLIHELRGLAQLSVHPQEQYSEPVLAPILDSMSHYIRTMGVQCERSEKIPNVLMRIDPLRIEQVMSNLVTNALKHTMPGGLIRLGVTESNNASALEITVSDTGSGISPADMPFIFERHYQGGTSRYLAGHQSLQTGVGLGLSICKHIVDEHAGTISFHSREQTGTTFCVCLPLS